MRILVIEDDNILGSALQEFLREQGYAVDWVSNGSQVFGAVSGQVYQLLILDLNLPDMNGLEVLKQLRAQGHQEPTLILTARDAIEDRINGLDSGADDYLVKPFALAELQARVRALIRRYQGHSDNLLTDGDITLNLQTQQVLRQSQPVEVTPKEFALLTRLIMRSGQTVHRETLQQDIYSWQDDPGSNTLEVHIHNLRRKLGKDRIKTVRGVGYRLESQK